MFYHVSLLLYGEVLTYLMSFILLNSDFNIATKTIELAIAKLYVTTVYIDSCVLLK